MESYKFDQGLTLRNATLYMDSIAIYRNLLKDDVFKNLYRLISSINNPNMNVSTFLNYYNDLYFSMAQSGTNSIKSYILKSIILEENPFSVKAGAGLDVEEWLVRAAGDDLDGLQHVSKILASELKEYALKALCRTEFEENIIKNLPEWSNLADTKELSISVDLIEQVFSSSEKWSKGLGTLRHYFEICGSGIVGQFRAFIWDHSGAVGTLKGIENPDSIKLTDLIGYHDERSEIINNTQQFLNGYRANNVLLYGDRGTGKSSTVKAIVNEYYSRGLRIIEVSKKDLVDFPEIIRNLKGRKQKFILFVDDLAFEENEDNYTALKTVLEGGLEAKSDNVLIYATSNRRHLVKERFSDRAGFQSQNYEDEVRSADTMQEKLSLSDRFGITVVFSSPNKNKYLEIVEGIAANRGLKFDREQLHREAMKWELWYNGLSPRTAKQFVDWLEGQEDM
ncbi:MAG: putative ATPase superfamily [Clostridiales bacterium]|jgi:predicted AAA+ superfamily ATPase|nr:putative ATPase superfamily [Clostridiales bacterium]